MPSIRVGVASAWECAYNRDQFLAKHGGNAQ
ncbi:hypothetical protein AB7M23_000678 [Pseudomonas sp. HLS-6 TE3448]